MIITTPTARTTDAPTKTITVTRYQLDTPGRPQRWACNYVVEGDPMTWQYGPGLRDLRAMLSRTYPGSTVVETWRA